jgi:hypothetical protein
VVGMKRFCFHSAVLSHGQPPIVAQVELSLWLQLWTASAQQEVSAMCTGVAPGSHQVSATCSCVSLAPPYCVHHSSTTHWPALLPFAWVRHLVFLPGEVLATQAATNPLCEPAPYNCSSPKAHTIVPVLCRPSTPWQLHRRVCL